MRGVAGVHQHRCLRADLDDLWMPVYGLKRPQSPFHPKTRRGRKTSNAMRAGIATEGRMEGLESFLRTLYSADAGRGGRRCAVFAGLVALSLIAERGSFCGRTARSVIRASSRRPATRAPMWTGTASRCSRTTSSPTTFSLTMHATLSQRSGQTANARWARTPRREISGRIFVEHATRSSRRFV